VIIRHCAVQMISGSACDRSVRPRQIGDGDYKSVINTRRTPDKSITTDTFIIAFWPILQRITTAPTICPRRTSVVVFGFSRSSVTGTASRRIPARTSQTPDIDVSAASTLKLPAAYTFLLHRLWIPVYTLLTREKKSLVNH